MRRILQLISTKNTCWCQRKRVEKKKLYEIWISIGKVRAFLISKIGIIPLLTVLFICSILFIFCFYCQKWECHILNFFPMPPFLWFGSQHNYVPYLNKQNVPWNIFAYMMQCLLEIFCEGILLCFLRPHSWFFCRITFSSNVAVSREHFHKNI